MLNQKIADLINEQIMKELYSAYLYIDMANFYADAGLDGFDNYFYVQAQEERDHAMLFRTFMLNNSAKITLLPIDGLNENFKEFGDPLKRQLEHEQSVTASINNIYKEADKINDYKTREFLNWFVKEQGEEEKNAEDMITKYNLFGSNPEGLYSLDQEYAARVYAPPSLVLD
jgi:ferritin